MTNTVSAIEIAGKAFADYIIDKFEEEGIIIGVITKKESEKLWRSLIAYPYGEMARAIVSHELYSHGWIMVYTDTDYLILMETKEAIVGMTIVSLEDKDEDEEQEKLKAIVFDSGTPFLSKEEQDQSLVTLDSVRFEYEEENEAIDIEDEEEANEHA